jgi:hypothetical protein
MYIARSSWYIVNLGMGFVDFSCGCGDGDQDFYLLKLLTSESYGDGELFGVSGALVILLRSYIYHGSEKLHGQEA